METDSDLADHPAGANDEFEPLTRVRTIFWLVGVALAASQAWVNRQAMGPDGISYIDLGEAWLRGDWDSAINGFWSPMYPWLLGLALKLSNPSPYYEFVVVHAVGVLIFVLAFLAFEFLLKELVRRHYADGREGGLPAWALAAVSYSLFLWASIVVIGVGGVSPDLLMSVFLYLAAGMLLRIANGDSGLQSFILLGLILGFGYLAKAPLFVLAFPFLGLSLLAANRFRSAVPYAVGGLLVFLVVASVLIVPLSINRGRLTFGESGRLNYAWGISGVPRFIHWQGDTPGLGTPLHPTRRIFEKPAAYEFATPFRVTYPPWYDPSYWYDGAASRVALSGHASMLKNVIWTYVHILHRLQSDLIIVFLVLAWVGWRGGRSLRNFARSWLLLACGAGGLLMYALVNIEPRYVGGFFLLLWLGLISGLDLPSASPSRRWIKGSTFLMIALLAVSIGGRVINDVREARKDAQYPHWKVAEEVWQMGIRPGDPVASIGDTLRGFWARLAHVRVVAEVPGRDPENEIPAASAHEFWAADAALQSQVVEALFATGARAIIADQPPPEPASLPWIRIGDSHYYVLRAPGLQ